MTKVVINNCYGGFSLSDAAFEMYLNLKGIKYFKWADEIMSTLTHYTTVSKEEYKNVLGFSDTYLSMYDIVRDDLVLVKVIEEMGNDANGRCAELKIIEIPDDVAWEIYEYDGNEHIAEKHRTWS